ncbi:hypothetical protein MU582_08110 [Nocardioidaceae bacterium SCSIO 66511]|nr:hypothetical protein MU582_08110 [Nocardioidaceae bacterium SCSIO 66511]
MANKETTKPTSKRRRPRQVRSAGDYLALGGLTGVPSLHGPESCIVVLPTPDGRASLNAAYAC